MHSDTLHNESRLGSAGEGVLLIGGLPEQAAVGAPALAVVGLASPGEPSAACASVV